MKSIDSDNSRFSNFMQSSGNLLRAGAFATITVLGIGALAGCTDSPAAENTSPAVADVYTGTMLEIVADPITPGPVGEQKSEAIAAIDGISSTTIDETTLPAIKSAMKAVKAIKNLDPAVKVEAGFAISEQVMTAVAATKYDTYSDTADSVVGNQTLYSQEKAAIAAISTPDAEPDVLKAAPGILDDIVANAAAETATADLPHQRKLLLGLVTDPTIKDLAQKAAAGDTVSSDALSEQKDAAETVITGAFDELLAGSAGQAYSINQQIDSYKKNLSKDVSRTWLKDVGQNIVDSLGAAPKTNTPPEIKAAQVRAKKIPNAAVSNETLQAIDNTIAENLRYESLVGDVAADTAIIKVDNDDLALIIDKKTRAEVSTILDYERGQTVIDQATYQTDPAVPVAILASIVNPKIKQAAKAVNGGADATAYTAQTDAATAVLANAIDNPSQQLFFGSNKQAQAINKEFEAYNAAVAADGR